MDVALNYITSERPNGWRGVLKYQVNVRKYAYRSAGHQVCVRSVCALVFFSLPITDAVLSDSLLSGRPPEDQEGKNNSPLRMNVGAGLHPDSQQTVTGSHHPKPMERRVQLQNSLSTGSLWGELGHSTLFLSLTSSACVSLIISFSLSGSKHRLERGAGNKWRTLPDSLLFISQLSTVNNIISVVFTHLLCFRNSVACILT